MSLVEKPDTLLNLLLEKVSSYNSNQNDLLSIEKAFHFASKCHENQTRQSGEPYITHPLSVALILSELKLDTSSLLAAILHDVVEDTPTTVEDVEKAFNPEVAQLVDGLTKIGKISFQSKQERLAENFRKMVIAMAKDIRVIIVKLADRLHNMRTLDGLALDKRKRIALETLEIYAPLAGRLGIYGIKSELEDLCLKEIKNVSYKEISSKVLQKKQERKSSIEEVKLQLEAELKNSGFNNALVYGRPKHFYSIYKKMIDRQIAFEDIHDLFAFRIIVGSIKECYEVLGIVHAMWKPMPGRFKDYIAMPKANLYQSLHTTVVRPSGMPVEIQIRTQEMHQICEYGIAAHWIYKEKEKNIPSSESNLKKFTWLRQMMELGDDVKDPSEFMSSVKLDLFEEEIFVFTPKGDVIALTLGSTPLDFAFAVHTGIGLKTSGAKVNGKITPLRSKLRSGDRIEIITSNHQKPSKDWLSFVTTAKARNKIRSYLRSEQREKSKKIGLEILTQELIRYELDPHLATSSQKASGLIKQSKEDSLENVLISIGYGKLNARELLHRVFPNLSEPKQEPILPAPTKQESQKNRSQSSSGVLVSGMDNILVSFGKCCNPIPGEPITGFITRGRGVSIHREECGRTMDLDPVRRIDVSWSEKAFDQGQHNAILKVVSHDRQGILADVTLAISNMGCNIKRAEISVSKDKMGVLIFEMSLKDLTQLNSVIHKIESVPDVVFVERLSILKK